MDDRNVTALGLMAFWYILPVIALEVGDAGIAFEKEELLVHMDLELLAPGEVGLREVDLGRTDTDPNWTDFGNECRKCHSTAGFRPTLFSNALHSKTAFPLQGKHNATACSACHKTERPRADSLILRFVCT